MQEEIKFGSRERDKIIDGFRFVLRSCCEEGFMKRVVFVVFLAGLCCVVVMSGQQDRVVAELEQYGRGVTGLIIHERTVVSGVVRETPQGMAVATTDGGMFLVKGYGLGSLVGETVRITGAVRGRTIFAIDIDVQRSRFLGGGHPEFLSSSADLLSL